jgi:hypothetical protein
MRMLAAVVCVLTLAACGEDDPAANQGRIVTQDRLDNPLVDTGSVDLAVQTEAMGHMRTIADRIKLKAATSGDPAALFRSLAGQLNSTTLGKIGLSESDLTGSFYKASDYTIVIVDKTLTITAAQIGSRGRVEPQKFKLP